MKARTIKSGGELTLSIDTALSDEQLTDFVWDELSKIVDIKVMRDSGLQKIVITWSSTLNYGISDPLEYVESLQQP